MLIKKGSVSLYDYCMSNPDKAYLLDEWDYEKNKELGLDPKTVTSGTHKKAHWVCKKCGHKWQAEIRTRVNGVACPECYNQRRSEIQSKVKLTVSLTDYCKDNPDKAYLLEEWDYEENSKLDISPENISYGSGIIAHWICKECNYRWPAQVRSRVRGNGCPDCYNQNRSNIASKARITTTLLDYCRNNLNKAYLLNEWDYEENNKLGITPENIAFKSNKKVFWVCSKDKRHKWEATIYSRVEGSGCPVCAGQKVLAGYNDIATTHPELVKEWDYQKNYPITPQEVIAGSIKRYYWKCSKCGHEWIASLNDRALGHTGCPECNKVGTSIQELAVYYYIKKIFPDTINCYKDLNYELDIFIPAIQTAIEFDGGLWHQNRLESDNKKDLNCKRDNIRLIRIREKELEPTTSAEIIWINGNSDSYVEQGIKDLFEYMNWNYDFEINFSNDYSKFINIKNLREIENSLAVKFPEIAAQWHPTKNGSIKPINVSAFSSRKFWWQCPTCGHEWSAVVSGRTRGNNCPSCSGRLPWSNEEIQIMLEHYEKEGLAGTLPLLPNRNKGTIIAKASELNLRSRIGEWTEEEIQIMLDYYESEGPTIIMNRLPNKTKSSITHKAQRLGLKYYKK